MSELVNIEDLLDKKRDYSPLLVHLTRADADMPAGGVLQCILNEKTLRAYNYHCLFKGKKDGEDGLEKQDESIQDLFKVTCFTETPIDQIDLLTLAVWGKRLKFEPYGLVFTKEYIRQKEGNPAFYLAGRLSQPLWKLYKDAVKDNFPLAEYKVLALINKCDKGDIDFHWEREWRIVGNLEFKLEDVFCGLCPEKDIDDFTSNYGITFISPDWGINKILGKLVAKKG